METHKSNINLSSGDAPNPVPPGSDKEIPKNPRVQEPEEDGQQEEIQEDEDDDDFPPPGTDTYKTFTERRR